MTATTRTKIIYFAAGWLVLLLIKYVVFGLMAWNNIFHPGLIPAPNQQQYLQPFLGIFSQGAQ
jgi:hypothetical protein